jgi:hypothetical protein
MITIWREKYEPKRGPLGWMHCTRKSFCSKQPWSFYNNLVRHKNSVCSDDTKSIKMKCFSWSLSMSTKVVIWELGTKWRCIPVPIVFVLKKYSRNHGQNVKDRRTNEGIKRNDEWRVPSTEQRPRLYETIRDAAKVFNHSLPKCNYSDRPYLECHQPFV